MQILNCQEQLKRQLAEQRVVDRHHGRMEDLGATAEETLSNGAVIGGDLMAGKSFRGTRGQRSFKKLGKSSNISNISNENRIGWFIFLFNYSNSVVCGPPDLSV